MNNPALETLFYGLKQSTPVDGGKVLFLNARAHAALTGSEVCVQWFKPYSDALVHGGYDVKRRVEDVSEDMNGTFDTVYLLIPKNMTEARYLIAMAFGFLKPEGKLYCSCENKAGGTRLQKTVQQFGADIVQQISKHKSRFVEVVNVGVDQETVDVAIKAGAMQATEKTEFTSQAGIYGWDKIDKGSHVLLQHIPQDLKGKIADFGCGYGYLLQHILQQNDAVKKAYAIDADARALDATRANVGDDVRAEYLWTDLTVPKNIPDRLDTIIMNPPFHEGKKTDSEIGISFIKTAAASLHRNGVMYMVANNQLPYEPALNEAFFTCEVIAQSGGFKVFKAVK